MTTTDDKDREQRLAIIRDARELVLGGTVLPHPDYYVYPYVDEKGTLVKGMCKVCALGALFVGWTQQRELDGGAREQSNALYRRLSKVFSVETLILTEVAFEGVVPDSTRAQAWYTNWCDADPKAADAMVQHAKDWHDAAWGNPTERLLVILALLEEHGGALAVFAAEGK